MARGPRGVQEDRFAVVSLRDGYLLAVFDGHNGDGVSDLCAKRLPKLALDLWFDCQKSPEECYLPRMIIRALLEETMDHISGSTVSLVHVNETKGRADIAFLGDSPVVVGAARGPHWVSNEHNVRSNTEDREFIASLGGIIDHGYLCVMHDGYLSKCLQLTRALGDVDFNAYLIREPEYHSLELKYDSIVAVMSDGIYSGHTIRRPIDLSMLPLDDAPMIVDGALKRGTGDNVTAVVWHA